MRLAVCIPLRLQTASRVLHVVGALSLLACSVDSSPTSRHDLEPRGVAHDQNDAEGAGIPDFEDAGLAVDTDASRASDAGSAQTPTSGEADTSSADASAPGAPPAADRATLIAPGLWLPVGLLDDPFEDRPEVPRCPRSALMAEILSDEPVFSVNTGECDYVTVSQPTLREATEGETIRVRLWHFELTAPEPAEAHVALHVDGLPVLDERIMIPQPGGLITKELQLTRAIPAGAPVYFHLHNHGSNSWSLVEVSAGRQR